MKNVELLSKTLSRTVYKVYQTAIYPMEKVFSESRFNHDTIWPACESVDVIRGALANRCEGDTNGIMYLN